MWVNGGSHGIVVSLAPADFVRALSASVADLAEQGVRRFVPARRAPPWVSP